MDTQQPSRSKVLEVVRKIDMQEKLNPISSVSSPIFPPLKCTPKLIEVNNNQTSGTSILPVNSSNGSIKSDEIGHSNSTERRRQSLMRDSTKNSITNTTLLTNRHISTAKINIRPAKKQRPSKHCSRTPPLTPSEVRGYPKSNQSNQSLIFNLIPVFIYFHLCFDVDNPSTYSNTGHRFKDYQNHTSHDMNNENGFDDETSIKTYAKPVFTSKEFRVPLSTQTAESHRLKGITDSDNHDDDRLPGKSSVRNKIKCSSCFSLHAKITKFRSRINTNMLTVMILV